MNQYQTLLLQHTPVGMAIYDGENFCLLQANPRYLSLLAAQDEDQDNERLGLLPLLQQVVETGDTLRGSQQITTAKGRPATCWSWSLDPVRNQEGRVAYVMHTLSEVPAQIMGTGRTPLPQSMADIGESVARSVQESIDTGRIGSVVMETIRTSLDAHTACLHIADPVQKTMRLLCTYTPPGYEKVIESMRMVPYERITHPIRQALDRPDPIVIEDLQMAAAAGEIGKSHPLVRQGERGYACIPLWFRDQFTGTLSATFSHPILPAGWQVRTLVSISGQVAAALAHARLHEELEQERNRLRSILDQLPEGILILEVSDGTISYANPAAAQLLGRPHGELSGKPLNQCWYPLRGKPAQGGQFSPWGFVAVRALCGETIRSKETLIIKPDGSRVITLTSGAPLFAENGIMTGAMIVFQDVTMQKSLEEHKNEFLSIVNHELRTHITIIQGFAEILQLKLAQDQPLDTLTHYAITSISEQSQHMTGLIEEMLDLSRLEREQLTLRCERHDLLAIIRRVLGSQRVTTRLHQIRLTLEGIGPTEELIASVDEQRIVQVLNNLLNNAIKYSPGGGDIEIGVRRTDAPPGNEAMIWVRDQGIGIPADAIPHIFKRFHRARNLDPSFSGFGVGLYLVNEVVTRHRGRVWVESTEGKGSTFYVVLPLDRG
ncbi:MAG: PAS domain-containing protein [Ktedonobacteraceae bacterium]|nr:PAS domain-containing protein [Ktedonobacteraceae bacterium]